MRLFAGDHGEQFGEQFLAVCPVSVGEVLVDFLGLGGSLLISRARVEFFDRAGYGLNDNFCTHSGGVYSVQTGEFHHRGVDG